MGHCCGKHHHDKTTEEYDENKHYIDISLHDEHKIGFDFSVSKAREKMGVETVCEGKLTHDKELKYLPHSFEEEKVEHIPSVLEVMEQE